MLSCGFVVLGLVKDLCVVEEVFQIIACDFLFTAIIKRLKVQFDGTGLLGVLQLLLSFGDNFKNTLCFLFVLVDKLLGSSCISSDKLGLDLLLECLSLSTSILR